MHDGVGFLSAGSLRYASFREMVEDRYGAAEFYALGLVCLIGAENHRRFRAAQDLCNLGVEICDSVLYVYDEKNEVCFFGGEGYLFADLFFEDVVGVDNPSAGVYERKLTRSPFALAVLAIARCPGFVADDGLAGSGESVEKCGLPYIGASHDGY